jgi:hypothetical protein
MNMLVKCWILFLLVSFFITVLGLSYVQARLIKKDGWRVFRIRRFFDLYWHDLRPLERLSIWPGLVAFFLTLFGAALVHLFGGS